MSDFVDLACLTYLDNESRTRRQQARTLLESTPTLVLDDVRAAAAAADLDALQTHLERGADGLDDALLALCYSRVEPRNALGCLDLLLAHGADPNAFVMITDCRFTALTGVIGEGEAGPFEQPPHPHARAMAERLLDAGADPNDSQALYNTHFLPSNAWLELLFARGLSSAPDLAFLLGQAAVQGFVDRVRLLLAHGVPANGRNRYNGRTHLENALREGHADIAQLLIDAGAPAVDDVDVTLHAAARHGRLDALERGLQRGLPIDGLDDEGLTPLHYAARNGHLEVVRALVARGASLDVRDPLYDGTPLGHARHFTSRWPRAHGDEIIALLSAASTAE